MRSRAVRRLSLSLSVALTDVIPIGSYTRPLVDVLPASPVVAPAWLVAPLPATQHGQCSPGCAVAKRGPARDVCRRTHSRRTHLDTGEIEVARVAALQLLKEDSGIAQIAEHVAALCDTLLSEWNTQGQPGTAPATVAQIEAGNSTLWQGGAPHAACRSALADSRSAAGRWPTSSLSLAACISGREKNKNPRWTVMRESEFV